MVDYGYPLANELSTSTSIGDVRMQVTDASSRCQQRAPSLLARNYTSSAFES